MNDTGDDVGSLFDSTGRAFASRDPVDWLDRRGGRIVQVHCKDVRDIVLRRSRNRDAGFLDAVVDGVFAIPGVGGLEFDAMLERRAAIGYDGWLVVEAETEPAVTPVAVGPTRRRLSIRRGATGRHGLVLRGPRHALKGPTHARDPAFH